jgi:CDP-glycerol glycerophosphotransferase
MITDYSSAMFDFAVTGKPMLFFTPDLEQYRDDVRGFYFDLEAEAPGPVCPTSDELIAALEDISSLHAAGSERYARFRERFCPLDDGRAAARVVDRVFPSA